jgi:alkanesulfonate monooxygenase SsuD/methylene tetrahydromethanopterin reductase-like flavin-dependent oxidoreductase (luciferase family)
VLRYGRVTQQLIDRRLGHYGPTQYTDVEAGEDDAGRRASAESVIGESNPLAAARLIEQTSAGRLDAHDFVVEEDMIIVGAPEMCIEKLRRYSDISADDAMCQVEFGFPHERIMRSIGLLGTRVAPGVASFRSRR